MFLWLFYYLTIKCMLLNYIDDQIVVTFLSEYRNIESAKLFNYNEFETLKWWIGFDIFAILLDLFSFFFGPGHLFNDIFGKDEVFFVYNPCNTPDLIYSDGNIIDKNTGDVVMDKHLVYYIKAVSLFSISTVFVVFSYYLIA